MTTYYTLSSKDKLTELARRNGINSWNELTEFIKNLPERRNKNRGELELVIPERKGTCSSKHAFLKMIADLNNVPDINLVIGIYKMNQLNIPKIEMELSKKIIEFIPEAHCNLKINGNGIDFTTKESEFKKIEQDIIEEKIINPEQISEFKVEYHKEVIKTGLIKTGLKFDFDQVWKIREQCIENVSN